MGGVDQDDVIILPLAVAMNRIIGRNPANARAISGVVLKVEDGADMNSTLERTRQSVRARHRLSDQQDDDFHLQNLAEIMKAREDSSRVLTVLLAAIGSVSLVVGGIGIMNIMLVSVTERTREIGIRRAIGARKRNIMTQFIMEAVVLCEVGGVIGVVLGILGGNATSYFLKLPPVIPVDWIVIGLVICSIVGIVFGTYPAYKAANLDPIESLRYE